MAKDKTVYVCSNCGQDSPKWVGKCPSCGEWNTSQAAMKLYNRRNEQLGDAAERISVMANYIEGATYPQVH